MCVCVVIECNNMNESQKHAKRKNPAFKGTFCMIHLYDMRGEGKGELQEYRDQNQIQEGDNFPVYTMEQLTLRN